MYKHLTWEQRYIIYTLLQLDFKKKDIAESIHVSPSTVSREIRRNSGKKGAYNPDSAHRNATYRKKRQPGNRAIRHTVWDTVFTLLKDRQWSPKQISGFLANKGVKISHETIYKCIRKDKASGGTLYKCCRHRLKHRRRPVGEKRFKIKNRTSIDLRPKEADGTRFGDFEMDTIIGKGNKGAIVTIMERSTNMIFMRKLKHGKNAKETALTVVRMLDPFKKAIRTITTDNGLEFAEHEYIAKRLGTTVYFAHPHSPWQKGAIENGNGLIRQYIPNGTDFNNVSQQKLKAIQEKLNNRPRAKLNFSTPKDNFTKNIQYICTC